MPPKRVLKAYKNRRRANLGWCEVCRGVCGYCGDSEEPKVKIWASWIPKKHRPSNINSEKYYMVDVKIVKEFLDTLPNM